MTRTCFRCGAEFESGGIVCDGCRAPRIRKQAQLKPELTPRELQVVKLVATAKLNKEIAYDLRLTEGTIKEYMHRIFLKLGIANRTELAMWAVRGGIA